MIEKPLKKQSKTELLELLLAQSREIERLKNEIMDLNSKLQTANRALHEREIKIFKAGSIAEAALMVNNVFTVAEEAAAQYVENIEQLSKKQYEIYAEKEAAHLKEIREQKEQVTAECDLLREQTTSECNSLKEQTAAECNSLKEQTAAECNSLKEQTAAECNSLKEQAAAECNSLKEQTTAECNSLKEQTTAECNSLKEQTAAECNSLKEQTTAECNSLKEQTAAECNSLKEQTTAECNSFKKQTELACEELENKTNAAHDKRLDDTQRQIDINWEMLAARWETLCSAHDDMRNILGLLEKR